MCTQLKVHHSKRVKKRVQHALWPQNMLNTVLTLLILLVKEVSSCIQGCIKCKLALRDLAAYLLNGLQRSSSLQSRRKQRWRLLVLILRKITK